MYKNIKKIIMTGFCQTGQISPAVAIHSYGYNCHGFDRAAMRDAIDGDYDKMFYLVDKFDCLRDWPFNIFAPEIAAEFPEAMFLHTYRITPDKWFDAMMPYTNHESSEGFGFIFEYWFGKRHLCEDDRADAIAVYESHNNMIQDDDEIPSKRLRYYCIDLSNHWEPLASAIGQKTWPDFPFPAPENRPAWVYYTQAKSVIGGWTTMQEDPALPWWGNNSFGGD